MPHAYQSQTQSVLDLSVRSSEDAGASPLKEASGGALSPTVWAPPAASPPHRSHRHHHNRSAAPMFHISRELYRELAPDLQSDRDREHVLHACEATVHRLVTDRFYFAHPART